MERGEVNTVAQHSTHYAPFRHASNATYRFCILFFGTRIPHDTSWRCCSITDTRRMTDTHHSNTTGLWTLVLISIKTTTKIHTFFLNILTLTFVEKKRQLRQTLDNIKLDNGTN